MDLRSNTEVKLSAAVTNMRMLVQNLTSALETHGLPDSQQAHELRSLKSDAHDLLRRLENMTNGRTRED